MYFLDVEAREPKDTVPGVQIRTFWGDNLLLASVELGSGSEVPSHTHPHEQGGIMLEGDLEMDIAGETRRLKPGDVYIIPGNVAHGARCVGAPARVLDIFSPVREDFKY